MSETEFNWYTELNKAIEKEPSIGTLIDLRKRADDWVTCGCGQLCKALPRNLDGKPKDRKLSTFGIYFANYIHTKNWINALKILNKIEARTSQLLNEQK